MPQNTDPTVSTPTTDRPLGEEEEEGVEEIRLGSTTEDCVVKRSLC